MAPASVTSGSASGTVMAAPARVTEPPANLPMAAPESAMVPPSAANPTYPPVVASPVVNPQPVPAAIPAQVKEVVAAEPTALEAVTEQVSPSNEALVSEEDDDLDLPELSPEATAFFTSKRYIDSNTALQQTFHLNQDDISFLQEMDQLVLGGALPLDGYVTALRGEFPAFEAARREQLIAKLIVDRFLPWGDALKPSAQEVARKEKMALPAAAYYTVYTKPLTYSGAAGEVARTVDLPMGGQLRERLRDLVMSRAKGIRVDAQVEEQMTRPIEFGGMGLEREKARMAILAMSDILSRAQVMTEENYSAWLAEQARLANAPKEAEAAGRSKTKEDEEDQREIAAISAKMPKPVRDTSSVLALSTNTLMKRLSVKPEGEYLVRRLENLVSTRLRDVRSRHDVLLTLSRDVKVGGLGLSRADAEHVSGEIEDGYTEFRTIIAQEEKDKLDNQAQEQTRKIEERKKREAEEHARWFQEKVKGQQLQTDSQKELVERMRTFTQGLTSPVVAAHPIDIKEQVKEERDLGKLVAAPPPTPSSVASKPAPSAFITPSAPAAKPVAVSPRPPVETVQAASPSVVKVSAVTAAANQASAGMMRPRMDDIRPMTARLSGPLAEIQNLNLAAFRRMAKNPTESAMQIQRKIDLLAQESFERRIEGIQAWQSSPLQQAYLTLVAQAFAKATPVNALVTQKRAAGEDVLSAEELAAVVDLNGKLHF